MGYTPSAAATAGGVANMRSYIANAIAGSNVTHTNSLTDVSLKLVGTYQTADDPAPTWGATLVSWLAGYSGSYFSDFRTYADAAGADQIGLVGRTTDTAGNAYQPGRHFIVADTQIWWGVIGHESGHNFGANHDAGACITGSGGAPFRTIMKHNYCSGTTIQYFSHSSLTYDGTSIAGGNNAGIVYSARNTMAAHDSPVVLTSNGIYEIEPAHASGKRVEVAYAATADHSPVMIYNDNNGSNQRWRAISLGSGIYSFQPQHATGSRMDVYYGSSANGTDINIHSSNGATAQQFKLLDKGSGLIELEPMSSPGLRMEVEGGSTANLAQVQIWATTGASYQRFYFYEQ